MSNTLGRIIRLTTFGESHGQAIGGILDGLPSKMKVDITDIQKELDRRKPGQSAISTERKESDQVKILSGVFNSITLGTPICFVFENSNARASDYDALRDVHRPSHADLSWEEKFGIRDHRGGGRSSARETANWVAAGALVKPLLEKEGITICSYVSSIGKIQLQDKYGFFDDSKIYGNDVRCPETGIAAQMETEIKGARENQDSLGGMISTVIKGVPPGLGEPVFGKLSANLGKAILGLNAVKGIEFGSGFDGSKMKGSEHNDPMTMDRGRVDFGSNNSGGILGGISNGNNICFRVAFKPTASIGKKQATIDKEGNNVELEIKGRHDPCVVPRAVPIIKGLVSLVLADLIMLNKLSRFEE